MAAELSQITGSPGSTADDRSMFNLHIGIPGIIPDLLHSIAQTGILKADNAPQVLPRKLWQEQFRSLVNARRTTAAFNVTDRRSAEVTIGELSARGPVAASQHALLGLPEDCFFKNKVLPYTEARIGQISEIFAAVPLTFHLTIRSQFDYLRLAMNRRPEDRALTEPRIIPSWAQLVHRIKASAPDSQVVVWDFEQPEKVALAFLICLLDTRDGRLIETLAEYLGMTLKRPEMPLNNHEIPGIAPELADRLDVQYELDLKALDQIDGVSLILPENVPEEFHF
ncbi:MAG: hypothetical protein ACK5M4_01080 [Pseudorhodobacter sp.]